MADGSTVDATVLGQSVDLIYMRGKWSDYAKSTQTDGTVLVFTRQVNGVTETVKVDAGTSKNFDRLIFADGAVTTFNATTAIVGNPNVTIDKVAGSDLSKTTPLYSDKQVAAALATIRDAAEANNATGTAPSLDTYMVAGIKGVTAGNLGAVNDALNSASIKGASVDTAPEVQALVNAYKAILASADGIAGNTATPLTDVQYATIGVTGVSAATGAGTTLNLLDDVVDRSASAAAVDTVGEVQAMADAAADVLAAAGGTAAQAAALSLSDLVALGVTGVTSDNLVAVQAKIQSATDAAVDTRTEVQGIVNEALGGIAAALNTIKTAAENNSATPTSPDLGV